MHPRRAVTVRASRAALFSAAPVNLSLSPSISSLASSFSLCRKVTRLSVAARPAVLSISHLPRDQPFFIKSPPQIQRRARRERDRQRSSAICVHRVFLSTMKSASHRGNPPTTPSPEPATRPPTRPPIGGMGTESGEGRRELGGREGDAGAGEREQRVTRPRGRGGFRMDFARFNGTRHADVNLPALGSTHL